MRKCPSERYGDGFLTAIYILIEATPVPLHIIDHLHLQILNHSMQFGDGASEVVIIHPQQFDLGQHALLLPLVLAQSELHLRNHPQQFLFVGLQPPVLLSDDHLAHSLHHRVRALQEADEVRFEEPVLEGEESVPGLFSAGFCGGAGLARTGLDGLCEKRQGADGGTGLPLHSILVVLLDAQLQLFIFIFLYSRLLRFFLCGA